VALTASELLQGYSQAVGLRESLRRTEAAYLGEIQGLAAETEILDLVARLFQKLIDREVTASVTAVERLQVEGLQRIFTDQDIEVKSTVEVQRGKVSVSLTTIQHLDKDNSIEGASDAAFGGSVTTVQSVILRITVLFRRGMRPVLFLDEALPAVDTTYVVNTGYFLRGLCARLGMDLLMVTHLTALEESADRSYRITNRGGVASVREQPR